MMTVEDRFTPAVDDLPPGWSLASYVGPGGQDLYALYVDGRREVAGLPSVESARRWAVSLSRHRPRCRGARLAAPLAVAGVGCDDALTTGATVVVVRFCSTPRLSPEPCG